MQEYSVKVTLPDGQVMAVTASESDTLEAVADRFKDYYEDDIILGIVNGRLRELNKKIKSMYRSSGAGSMYQMIMNTAVLILDYTGLPLVMIPAMIC